MRGSIRADFNLYGVALARGQLAEACALLEEIGRTAAVNHETELQAIALMNLADVHLQLGDAGLAESYAREALPLVVSRSDRGAALHNLGLAIYAQERPVEARQVLAEAVELSQATESAEVAAYSVVAVAATIGDDHPAEAATLLAAIQRYLDERGTRLAEIEDELFELTNNKTRRLLTDEVLEKARQRGRAKTLAQACHLAIQLCRATPRVA